MCTATERDYEDIVKIDKSDQKSIRWKHNIGRLL